MFSDPNLLAKIASNASTKHLLADPSFMLKLRQVQSNPQLLQQELLQDQRLMQVMAMLLGINMNSQGHFDGEPMQTDEPVYSHVLVQLIG
jgi:stress-induced-phosphoprotein 1